jgi:hypothetical protein
MTVETTSNLGQYATPEEAAKRDDVEFSTDWIRRLAQTGKVEAVKLGAGQRGPWLIHIPSLLEYIQEMEELGTKKHRPN